MDEKRNDKRQKRIIILLLLFILFLLVFIVMLLLRKPTVIIQDNEPKTDDTQEVITDDKSRSSDQTLDDITDKEEKKTDKKPITPKKEEEKEPTPTPTPTPDPEDEKMPGKVDTVPVSLGPLDSKIPWDGNQHDLVSAGSSSTGTMMYCVTEYPSTETGTFTSNIPQMNDAGHYYVWYYSKGDSNHKDTAKDKVEVWINGTNGSFSAPIKKTSLSYNGTNQDLYLNLGSMEGGSIYFALGTNNITPPAIKEFTTNPPQGKNAGTYYVWYYGKGDGKYNDNDNNGEYYCDEITIASINPAICTAPTAVSGLKYSKGASLTLINPGSAYNGNIQTGLIRYGITDISVTDAPLANSTNYPYVGDSQEVTNSNLPKGINAGKYRIWYYVDGIGEYDDTTPGYIDVTVDQIQGNIVFAPTAKSPLYVTGEPQVLLDTSNLSKSFTLEYSIDNKQTWSEDVPTGTDAKTYTVWYRTKETNNYSSSEPKSIDVIIEKPYAALDVAPTAIPGVVYKGTAVKIAREGSATGGKIKYTIVKANAMAPVGQTVYYDSIPVVSEPGEYRLEYYIEPDSTHQEYPGGEGLFGSEHNTLSLNNLKLYSSPAVLSPAPEAIEGIVEDGFEHELVTPGTSSSGIVKYALLTESVIDPSTIEDFRFTTKVPAATDQGTYHIYYYGAESGDIGRSDIGHCVATINYPRATFTTLPTVESIKYNGSAQAVAKEGTAEGTIYYAVTTDSTEPDKNYDPGLASTSGKWETTIPTVIFGSTTTTKDAGSYYVWAYIKGYTSGEKQYSDSEMVCVTCTIEKSAPTYTIEEPVINNGYSYDGNPHPLFTTEPATNDGTIMYYVSKSSPTDVTQSPDFYKSISKPTLDEKIYKDSYYVYYYIKGDDNHEDGEFKGPYQVDFINGTDPYYLNQPTGQSYVHTSIDAVVPKEILDESHKGSITPEKQDAYAIKYAVTTEFVQPSFADFKFYDEIDFTRTQMDTYYIWFFIAAKDGSSITPAPGAGGVSYTTATIGIEASFASVPKLINPFENTFDVVLYESGSFIPYSSGTSSNGTVYYALTSGENSFETCPSDSVFTPSLPSISDIGQYTLWSFVKGENGYSNGRNYEQLTFEVHRRAEIKTHPTLFENITLTKDPFKPIETYGASDDGDVLYSLRATNDNVPRSNEIGHFKKPEEIQIEYYGQYYLYYGVSSTKKYVENSIVYKLPITPNKKKGFVETPAVINQNADITEVYSVPLLESLATNPTGDISYAYTTVKDLVPCDSSFMYSYDDNLDFVCVSAPGTYYVWYRIDEDRNGIYGPLEPTLIGEVTVIGGGPTVTAPVVNTNLVYNGQAQDAFLEPATTSAGTIYYNLTSLGHSNGMNYDELSSDLPTITYPGDYRIYYLSRGNNGENSNSYYVDVTMEKAERENNISPKGLILQYNKDSQKLIEEPQLVRGSYSLEYMIGPGDGNNPTNDNWTNANSITAKDPGLYYIWYRVAEDSCYKASEASYVITTIRDQARLDIEPETDMMSKHMYDGNPVDPLSVKGYSSAGTVMYAYSTDKAVTPDLNEFKENLLIDTPNNDHERYYIFYYVKSNNALYYDSDILGPKEFVFSKKALEFTKKPSILGAVDIDDSTVIYKADSYKLIPGEVNEPEHANVLYAIVTEEIINKSKTHQLLEEDIWHTANDSTLFNAITTVGKYALIYRADPKEGDEAYYQSLKDPDYVWITVRSERETFDPDPTYTTVTEYAGESIPLITNTPKGKHGGLAHYALGEDALNAPDSALFSETIPTVNEPGTYYLWYYAGKVEGYSESIKYCHTITITAGSWTYNIPEVNPLGGKYTGAKIQLVEEVLSGDVTPGTMYYSFALYPSEKPEKANIQITDISTVADTNPGKYIIYYYYQITDGPSTDIKYVTAEIEKGDCTFEEINYPRSVGYIQFDDAFHNLVLDPYTSNTNYDIYYLCTKEDINPTYDDFKSTDKPNEGVSGTYHVWWYAKCNNGLYEDSDIHHFDVTIGKTAGFIGKEANPHSPDGKPVLKNGGYIYANGVKQDVLDTKDGVPYANGDPNEGLMYYVAPIDETNIDKSKFSNNLPTVKDEGKYLVYYYGPESPYHYETDIKSLEVNVERPSIDFRIPYSSYVGYRPNDKLPLFSDSGDIYGNLPDTNLHLVYALGTETTHPADDMFVPDQPWVSNAGMYYVYMFVANDYGYRVSDYKMKEIEVYKLSTGEIGYINIPPELINQNIVEDGELHNVFTDDVAKVVEDLGKKLGRDSVKMMYFLASENDYYQYYGNPPKYLFNEYIPMLNEPQVLSAGNYCLYSYLAGDGNNEDSEISYMFFNVTEGSDIPPEAIEGLEYNGSLQTLIKAGETNNGTYVYALSNGISAPATNEYSEDIPTATYAAGGYLCALDEYEVYYKKVYANGTTSSPQIVRTTIAQKISSFSQEAEAYESIIYTGQPIDAIKTPAVAASSDDGTVYYALYDHEPDLTNLMSARGSSSKPTKDAQIFLTAILSGKATVPPQVTNAGKQYIAYAVVPQYCVEAFIALAGQGPEPEMTPEDTNYTCLLIDMVKAVIGFDPISFDVIEINVTKQDMDITEPVGLTATWTGSPVDIVTPGSALQGEIYYAVTYEDVEPTDMKLFSNTTPQATNMGTYYVWWYAKASDPDGLYGDSEVKKLTAQITGDGPVVTRPIAKTDMKYNGENQEVLTQAPSTQSDGTFKYYVTANSPSTVPELGSFDDNAPTAKDVGTHYVWYYLDGTVDTAPEYITVSIAKGTVTVTKPPVLKDSSEILIYNNNPVPILEPGEVTNGTFMYALGRERKGTLVEPTFPDDYGSTEEYYSATNANAKWYAYYYIKGDEGYEDVEQVLLGSVQPTAYNLEEAMRNVVWPKSYYNLSTNGGSIKLTDGGKVKDISGNEIKEAEFRYYVYDKTIDQRDFWDVINNAQDGDFKAANDYVLNPGNYIVAVGIYNSITKEMYFRDYNRGGCAYEVEVSMGKADWKVVPDVNPNLTLTYNEQTKNYEANLLKEGTALPLKEGLKVTYKVEQGKYEGMYNPEEITGVDCMVSNQTGWFTVYAVIHGDEATVNDSDVYRFYAYVEPLPNAITEDPSIMGDGDPLTVNYTGERIYIVKSIGKTTASAEGGDMYFYVSPFATQPKPSKSFEEGWVEGDEALTNISVKDVGTYYLWYYAAGNGLYGQTELKSVKIVVDGVGPSITVTEPKANIIYDGKEFNLIGSEHSIFTSPFTATSGYTVKYCVTNDVMNEPKPADYATYGSDDFEKAKGASILKAQSYYLWFYADDGNGSTTEVTKMRFDVEKADITNFIEPVIYENIMFKIEPVQIAKAGIAQNGIVRYYVSPTDETPTPKLFNSLSSNPNLLTVTEPGDYYVWYLVDGDKNHNGIEPTLLGQAHVERQYAQLRKPIGFVYTVEQGTKKELITQGKGANKEIFHYLVGDDALYNFATKAQLEEMFPTVDKWPFNTDGFAYIETSQERTYYVWYFIEYGDGTYSDPECVMTYVLSDDKTPSINNGPISAAGQEGFVVWNGDDPEPVCLLKELAAPSNNNTTPEYAVTTSDSEPADSLFTQASTVNNQMFMVNEPGKYYVWYRAVNNGVYTNKDYIIVEVKDKRETQDSHFYLHYPSADKTTVVPKGAVNYSLLKLIGETKPGFTLLYEASKNKNDGSDINNYSIYPPVVNASDDIAGEWFIFYGIVDEQNQTEFMDSPQLINIKVEVADSLYLNNTITKAPQINQSAIYDGVNSVDLFTDYGSVQDGYTMLFYCTQKDLEEDPKLTDGFHEGPCKVNLVGKWNVYYIAYNEENPDLSSLMHKVEINVSSKNESTMAIKNAPKIAENYSLTYDGINSVLLLANENEVSTLDDSKYYVVYYASQEDIEPDPALMKAEDYLANATGEWFLWYAVTDGSGNYSPLTKLSTILN